eukprot:2235080-Pyramimonas_sp.AAC.2
MSGRGDQGEEWGRARSSASRAAATDYSAALACFLGGLNDSNSPEGAGSLAGSTGCSMAAPVLSSKARTASATDLCWVGWESSTVRMSRA